MSEEFFHIACRTERQALVITILDSMLNDYEQVCAMSTEMQTAIGSSKTKRVAIDMSNVIMITSVALFPFVRATSAASVAGGWLVLCNMSDPVAQVFVISQLIVENRPHAKYLSLAEDLESAFDQLNEHLPPTSET